MDLKPSRWIKGEILARAKTLGAIAAGCSEAREVDEPTRQRFLQWLAEGRHATMDFLSRNIDVRFDPRLLLPGASTVISMAFPYAPANGYHHPNIADFALGSDYHIVLRRRLSSLVEFIASETGASSRICVDSAPILERYWAAKSGVGFIGCNAQLIVPGIGSGVILAEIVTTLALEPDCASHETCRQCGRCIKECPGNALVGGIDASRCRSYLSIEHRGDLPAHPRLGPAVFGCDICRLVCPHNSAPLPEPLPEFQPDPKLLILDRDTLPALTSSAWKRLSQGSALRRIQFSQLKRNIED